MQLNLTGRHFEITPQLRRHVEDKLHKLEKLNSRIAETEIVVFKDRYNDVAEGKIHLSHTVLAAKAEAGDMQTAVSELVDRLIVQLKRYEGRLRNRKRHTQPRGE